MSLISNSSGEKGRVEFDGKSTERWSGFRARFEALIRQTKRKGITKKKKKKLKNQEALWSKGRIQGVMLSDVLTDQPAVPSNFDWTEGSEGPLEGCEWSWHDLQLADQQQLYDLIISCMAQTSPLHAQLASVRTNTSCGSEAWNILLNQFEPRIEEAVGLKVTALTSLHQKQGETLDDYQQRTVQLVNELWQLGRPQEDESVCNHVLTGLLDKYSTLESVWRTQIAERRRNNVYKKDDPSHTGHRDLCDMMRREYLAQEEKAVRSGKASADTKSTGASQIQALKAALQQQGVNASNREVKAMLSRVSGGKPRRGGGGGKYKPNGGIGKKKNNETRTCHRCGRIGHLIRDCHAKTHVNGTPLTKDKSGGGSFSGSSGNNNGNADEKVYVNISKLQGMTDANNNIQLDKQLATSLGIALVAYTANDMIQVYFSRTQKNIPAGTIPWIIDSGATHSITPYQTDLKDIQNVDAFNIQYGEGESEMVTKAGMFAGDQNLNSGCWTLRQESSRMCSESLHT
mmetsp:Transcript_11639/g.26361  ORF Transcript_11639/g.26361 Transcript_11639/m.26361 type:complete len:515 (-) Transcript_11639:602-2146(-)